LPDVLHADLSCSALTCFCLLYFLLPPQPKSTLFPYTTLFRSSEKDIPQDKFREYTGCREEAIESPDEIWRHTDSFGQNLVTFIRSEEHTSELQSRENLVCRLLLEKKNLIYL